VPRRRIRPQDFGPRGRPAEGSLATSAVPAPAWVCTRSVRPWLTDCCAYQSDPLRVHAWSSGWPECSSSACSGHPCGIVTIGSTAAAAASASCIGAYVVLVSMMLTSVCTTRMSRIAGTSTAMAAASFSTERAAPPRAVRLDRRPWASRQWRMRRPAFRAERPIASPWAARAHLRGSLGWQPGGRLSGSCWPVRRALAHAPSAGVGPGAAASSAATR
jgi:hypothetical protein